MDKRDKKKRGGGGGGPKEGSLAGFLKKRAPIYLGLTGLFLVFAVPQLTATSLEGLFPEGLTGEDRRVLEVIMSYDGPNGEGLTVLEAVDAKIKEEYGDDRIYGDRSAGVRVDVTGTGEGEGHYDVLFVFQTDEKEMRYMWGVDAASGEISGLNANAKGVIDLVDFYD